MPTVGDRIRIERSKRKWKQEDLGKRIGVSGSAIGMYERGERKLDDETLGKLADVFEVNTDYLLGRSNDPSSTYSNGQVNRAFLELPENTTDEEKEFLQKQLDLQLEIFRSLKKKDK
ncbi:XRE family transcriptional regulator [Brevibacillus nitrificans]|uniref:XRE family transcriptional regulator n=1 Tax=Brevibacillus nitrificans TaxID=651560 RepID=A0A3M8DRW0_9BACL|nr:helix-turn-helix domain-containing protein [Brevibacillus nitrificans]RNB90195.1 XRE family transcriptional regulator [Brevibacillus nitrificans]